MSKEIRMPFREYEDLISTIEEQRKVISELAGIFAEKENVMIIEQRNVVRNWSTYYSLVKDSTGELIGLNNEEHESKDKLIHNLRFNIKELEKKNLELYNQIPWWRK